MTHRAGSGVIEFFKNTDSTLNLSFDQSARQVEMPRKSWIEPSAFDEDEVLDAGWLPPVPELQLGLREVRSEVRADSEFDAEAFLSKVYRNQA